MASYGSPAPDDVSQVGGAAQAPSPEPAADLPSLTQRIEWYDMWEEQTRDAQKLARRDRQYYDNQQWTTEEIQKLNERRQPVLTKNYIARKINFIRGEEIKKRVDPVCRPRTPQHEDGARAMTDAMRYVEEEQKFDTVRSAVMLNVLVEGYGGALKSLEDDGGEYRHRLKHIEWDRLFYDPHSRAPDFSDAKYLGIVMWLDLDDALEMYPDAKDAVENGIAKDFGGTSDTTEDAPRKWFDRRRKRVKVCEMYFRHGQDWYVACFTQGADLKPVDKTPYLNEKKTKSVCPLKMVSCYVDSDGFRYGVVRALISPQDEINKRASKQLHLLSVAQVIASKDAVPQPEEFMAELAKPDGFAEMRPGFEIGKDVIVRDGLSLAQGQFQLLQEAKADINTIGPSSSTLPDMPESASGRAFIARQQAASQELGSVFDSLDQWTLSVFEIDLFCVRQYWTEEKWLRVTDDQELRGYRFVALNRRLSRGQRYQDLLQKGAPPDKALDIAAGNMAPLVMAQVQRQMQMIGQIAPEQQQQALTALLMRHPMMAEPIVENQVDQVLVDIVIDKAPETAVLAQEEFETLSQLLPTVVQARPDMAPTMVGSIFRASQLPGRVKREILQELDKGPDPQQAQMQQKQQQIAMADAEAGVGVKQTQAQLNAAKAQSEQAKTQIDGMKAMSEVERNQAAALRDAASAGEKAGGGMPQGGFPQ